MQESMQALREPYINQRGHLIDGGWIDRRIHAGNRCNEAGAGLGERLKTARRRASTRTSG